MKFAFIKEHLCGFETGIVCEVLEVSRSGYYAWLKRPQSARLARREQLAVKIAQVHHQSERRYGSPRVFEALQTQGESVCENTVADIMREREIRGKKKRKFVPSTTDSRHDNPVAANVLNREFDAALPDQKWAADITFIPTQEGWLYLAAVIDLCSRKIVGWSMAGHMQTSLISDALKMAVVQRRPGKGLLHHSDRGVQYTSGDYMHLLQSHEMIPSMSRKGDCWDNAPMESFWATLKTELDEDYLTRDQARASIFEYIEIFYNRQRLHSSLGYKSPETFEAGLN